MRRRSWFRPLAFVLVVWLVSYLAEPASLHACPTHGGGAHSAASQPAPAHHSHDAHHRSASDGVANEHASPAQGHDHHGGSGCTCPGACCPAASFIAPAPVIASVATIVIDRPSVQPSAAPTYRRSAPEHARPPSIGPPPIHLG